MELGLSGLAVTDHQGLYGAVRFSAAAREAGLRAIVGMEVELLDPAVPDPERIVVAAASSTAPRRTAAARHRRKAGEPARPPVERLRPPGHRDPRREDLRGVRARELGPHLVLIARDMTGYRASAGWPAPRTWRARRARRASPTSCSPGTPRASWR